MNFHSTAFWIFFAFICALTAVFRQRITARNTLLLVASYVFYASWDIRLPLLLLLLTMMQYLAGIALPRFSRPKILLWMTIGMDIGILSLFKLAPVLFRFFDISLPDEAGGLPVILAPIGLSFFTFQGLGYVIDVYRGEQKPEKNLLHFALFMGFFPLLLSGPIERARNLLPQLKARNL